MIFKPGELDTIKHFLSAGMEIATALCVPVLGGYWLDQRFETSPWLFVAGLVLGLILTALVLARLAKDSGHNPDSK
ncbi:MAG: AtpZ/AtpI family protein [Balneolaceae bacterium]